MDTIRFDAWTRRTFGAALGGLTASLLPFMPLDDAGAKNRKKKRRKKKRCRKVAKSCKLAGKKKRCCKKLACEITEEQLGPRCCRPLGSPCSGQVAFECCGALAQCLNNTCAEPVFP